MKYKCAWVAVEVVFQRQEQWVPLILGDGALTFWFLEAGSTDVYWAAVRRVVHFRVNSQSQKKNVISKFVVYCMRTDCLANTTSLLKFVYVPLGVLAAVALLWCTATEVQVDTCVGRRPPGPLEDPTLCSL